MSKTYLLMAENGTRQPKFGHKDLELCKVEAQRLSAIHKTKVFILEIIGTVELQQVPVTELIPVVSMKDDNNDDLPF